MWQAVGDLTTAGPFADGGMELLGIEPLEEHARRLAALLTVTIRGRAAPFWHFTAGATKSADTVSIRPEVPRLVNTGIQAFYAFTITYDNVHGTIGFLAPARRVRPEVP